MRFDIITIFPKIFDSYFNESIVKRAREKKLIDICVHDLRKFTSDKHKKVDDRPFGGGVGMVFKPEPLALAIDSILKRVLKSEKHRAKIILFSAAGKQFSAKTAVDFSRKYNHIIMIAGHYEGVDERIGKIVSGFGFRSPGIALAKPGVSDLSIGPYVLTGGELPAMVVLDAVARQIPGVLGKTGSLEEKRHGIGVPVYTRPEVFEFKNKKYRVPKVLLSGDHKKISVWRTSKAK